jgi:hypothetical protein
MTDLLTILNNITSYVSQRGFIDVCWEQLRVIISSEEASKWSADKRSNFMLHTELFIMNGNAVFVVRDALMRDDVTDLNQPLIDELAESLDDLDEFATGTNFEELSGVIDEYAEIIANTESFLTDRSQIEMAASHFKTFFLTLLTLDIKERIELAGAMMTIKPDEL